MRKKALNVLLLSALPMRVQYSRLSLCWHCDRNVGCVVLVGGEGEGGDWAFFFNQQLYTCTNVFEMAVQSTRCTLMFGIGGYRLYTRA